jgi:hypothetical protein
LFHFSRLVQDVLDEDEDVVSDSDLDLLDTGKPDLVPQPPPCLRRHLYSRASFQQAVGAADGGEAGADSEETVGAHLTGESSGDVGLAGGEDDEDELEAEAVSEGRMLPQTTGEILSSLTDELSKQLAKGKNKMN